MTSAIMSSVKRAGLIKSDFSLKRSGAVILLASLILTNLIFTRNFFSINTFWNVIIQVFPIMIIGLGMTLVIATGGIDISIGATMAFTAAVLAKLVVMNVPVYLAVSVAVLSSLLYGFFNGYIISRYRIQPIIVTLVLLTSGRGIAQLINDGNTISLFSNSITNLSIYRLGGVIPIQFLVMITLIVLFSWIMKQTTFGRYVEAMGGNVTASRLCGLPIFRSRLIVYLIVAFLSGIAAIFETSRIAAADANKIGKLIELDVVAAVAVGGTVITGGMARIFGTVIGAIVMQLITVTVNMNNIPYNYSLIIKAGIIIAALWLQRDAAE